MMKEYINRKNAIDEMKKALAEEECDCEMVPVIFRTLENIPTENISNRITGWISVKDRLPKEHDSLFKKLKGTDKWMDGMFESISDEVLVTVKFENGQKKTYTARTKEGEWTSLPPVGNPVVTHWREFPEPAED